MSTTTATNNNTAKANTPEPMEIVEPIEKATTPTSDTSDDRQSEEAAGEFPSIPMHKLKGPLGRMHKMRAGTSSPTDKMMSPTTQKLQEKRLLKNAKPTNLGPRFAQLAMEAKETAKKDVNMEKNNVAPSA